MSQLTTQTTTVEDKDELLSVRQAAQILGVNRMWLSGYLVASSIPFQSLGGTIGIRRGDLSRIKATPRRKKA